MLQAQTRSAPQTISLPQISLIRPPANELLKQRTSAKPVFNPKEESRSAAQEAFFDETETNYSAGLAALRDSRYTDFPRMVGIETMAVCNGSCTFCPYPTMSRKGDRMSDSLLNRLMDEMVDEFPQDLPFALCLTRLNEPFLDKRTFTVVDRMHEELPQATLWIYTNATPLNQANADRLRTWRNVELFNISFNHHEKEGYENAMGLPYERTVAHIDRLHEMHSAGELTFPINLSRVGDSTRIDDEFRKWCGDRWPRFGTLVWEEYDFAARGSTYDPSMVPDTGCHQWYHLSVLASGKILFCCADCEGNFPVGDVNDRSLLENYNDPQRKVLRAGLPSRRLVEPCYTCTRL